MKKFVIFAAASLFAVSVNAQKPFTFGVKAGLNLSSVSVVKASEGGVSLNVFQNDGMTAGFHAGVFANFSLGEFVGLQPELMFSMQGGKQKLSEFLGGEKIRRVLTIDRLFYVSLPQLI